jgi:hypothetical protein
MAPPAAWLLAVPLWVNQEYRSASAGSCANIFSESIKKHESRMLRFMSIGITGKIGLKKERYHFTALYVELESL